MSDGSEKIHVDKGQILVLGAALAMLLSFVLAVYLPRNRALKAARSQLAEAEAELADKMALAAQLPQLERDVAARRVDHEMQLEMVPDQPMVPQFLGTVADILTSEGIAQRDLVPQAPHAEADHTELPIVISFDGPFAAAFRVLARLQGLNRINRVSSLKLALMPGEKDLIRVEMQVIVYHGSADGKESPQVAGAGRAART